MTNNGSNIVIVILARPRNYTMDFLQSMGTLNQKCYTVFCRAAAQQFIVITFYTFGPDNAYMESERNGSWVAGLNESNNWRISLQNILSLSIVTFRLDQYSVNYDALYSLSDISHRGVSTWVYINEYIYYDTKFAPVLDQSLFSRDPFIWTLAERICALQPQFHSFTHYHYQHLSDMRRVYLRMT